MGTLGLKRGPIEDRCIVRGLAHENSGLASLKTASGHSSWTVHDSIVSTNCTAGNFAGDILEIIVKVRQNLTSPTAQFDPELHGLRACQTETVAVGSD